MPDISLQELHQWARDQLDQPVMLGYTLHKVNGQVPGRVCILLRLPDSERPNAEIEIESTSDANGICFYHVIFHLLPSTTKLPHPRLLPIKMHSQQQVIHWIKTGYKRLFSS